MSDAALPPENFGFLLANSDWFNMHNSFSAQIQDQTVTKQKGVVYGVTGVVHLSRILYVCGKLVQNFINGGFYLTGFTSLLNKIYFYYSCSATEIIYN